jgi:predicted nucleic acid-binding protein
VTRSESPASARPERAFLDANVIRGQQTTDILLSLADRDVFEPRWSEGVIDEMQRNKPDDLAQSDIDRRIRVMGRAFPEAMTSPHPQGLEDQMQADPKDKHVLAAAVHSNSDVLVTQNLKDFDPPSDGPHKMRVENLSQFLNRKLEEDPERVQAGLQDMLQRYKRDPRTMSALIDTMASQQELSGFAQKLNTVVPADQRGTSEVLTANQRGSAHHAALEGVAPPTTPQAPTTAPEARKPTQQGQGRTKGAEQEA